MALRLFAELGANVIVVMSVAPQLPIEVWTVGAFTAQCFVCSHLMLSEFSSRVIISLLMSSANHN